MNTTDDGADKSVTNDNVEGKDKYTLKKFDYTPKTFSQESRYDPLLVLPNTDTGEKTKIVTFAFTSPQFYSIGIDAQAVGENAALSIMKGSSLLGTFYVNGSDSGDFSEYTVGPLYFEEKSTEITLKIEKGAVRINRIFAESRAGIDTSCYDSDSKLNSAEPSEEAEILYSVLQEYYGTVIFSSQSCTVNTNAEIDAVYRAVGRYPAIRAGDLSDVPKGELTEIELAKDWHNRGGIVSFTWNWNSPDRMGGYYADSSIFSLTNAFVGKPEELGYLDLDGESIAELVASGDVTREFAAIVSDLDKVGAALTELSDANIPVLFNPLPDGGSGLYWWSTSGTDYVRLWKLVYYRLSNYHGLNNIIWVWSGGDKDYYPGDNRCDLIGESMFSEGSGEMASGAVRLDYVNDYTKSRSKKPAAVTGASGLPSPDILARDKAAWLFWTLYRGDFLLDTKGEVRFDRKDTVDKFYNHALVLTLDEIR